MVFKMVWGYIFLYIYKYQELIFSGGISGGISGVYYAINCGGNFRKTMLNCLQGYLFELTVRS